MLAFLPVLGPIITSVSNGFFGYFSKKQDIQLQTIKSGDDRVAAQQQLVLAFQNNTAIAICRDIMCYPVAIWSALTVWDSIVAVRWPDLMFHTVAMPPGPLEYLPIAVLTFLFGMNWLNQAK